LAIFLCSGKTIFWIYRWWTNVEGATGKKLPPHPFYIQSSVCYIRIFGREARTAGDALIHGGHRIQVVWQAAPRRDVHVRGNLWSLSRCCWWMEGGTEGGRGRTAGARQGFRFGGMSYRQAMVWDRGIPGLLRKLNFLHWFMVVPSSSVWLWDLVLNWPWWEVSQNFSFFQMVKSSAITSSHSEYIRISPPTSILLWSLLTKRNH
jgi:hypothetical protein